MFGKIALLCGTWAIPSSRISAAGRPAIACPANSISPSRGASSPLTARRTVDLPAPFGPTMHAIEPAATSRSSARRTSPPP